MSKIIQYLEKESLPVKIEPVQRCEVLQSLEGDFVQLIITKVQRLEHVGHRAEKKHTRVL